MMRSGSVGAIRAALVVAFMTAACVIVYGDDHETNTDTRVAAYLKARQELCSTPSASKFYF